MRKRRAQTFTAVPDWAIPAEDKGGHALASSFAVAELENQWVRLSAATQRALLGHPVFGKQEILVEDAGVQVRRSAFGTDTARTRFSFDDVTRAARARRKLLP
jgi:hypothetical protein